MDKLSLALPHLTTSELVFTDDEIKEIFCFFWPQRRTEIERLAVTDDPRRYGQALLIIAVDATYSMGFIDMLVNAIMRRKPGTSIKSLVRKLTRKYVKHWWNHASRKDLRDPKVYDTVRATIALKHRSRLELMLNGLAADITLPAMARPSSWR